MSKWLKLDPYCLLYFELFRCDRWTNIVIANSTFHYTVQPKHWFKVQ